MGSIAGFAQIEYRPPCHDFASVRQECFEDLLQIQELWLPLMQRHHVDAEHTLQRRLLEQVVQYNVTHLALPELNDDAHTVFVRLIAQFADALNAFVAHQVGDLLDEPRLVYLVRQLGDDNGLFATLSDLLD